MSSMLRPASAATPAARMRARRADPGSEGRSTGRAGGCPWWCRGVSAAAGRPRHYGVREAAGPAGVCEMGREGTAMPMDVRMSTRPGEEVGRSVGPRSCARCTGSSVPSDLLDMLVLAVAEACNNAILHATGEAFGVSIAVTDTTCTIVVSDSGAGFVPPSRPDAGTRRHQPPGPGADAGAGRPCRRPVGRARHHGGARPGAGSFRPAIRTAWPPPSDAGRSRARSTGGHRRHPGGRPASNTSMASASRRVMPMSSSPSRNRSRGGVVQRELALDAGPRCGQDPPLDVDGDLEVGSASTARISASPTSAAPPPAPGRSWWRCCGRCRRSGG